MPGVAPGCGGAGADDGALEDAVGGAGRAPGCGAGGFEDSDVVVAGTEAGIVRVGGGLEGSAGEAVEGEVPSGFMGAFLWSWIGGIVVVWWCEWCLGMRQCAQRIWC